MRRDSREAAYKVIYAENFNAAADADFIVEVYKEHALSDADVKFADKLIAAVRNNKSEIEEIISKHVEGYKIERLYSTDKCALMLAVAEMKYFDDIPAVVSIDEALYLVRKYSTDESLKFVNGILASFKRSSEVTEGDN